MRTVFLGTSDFAAAVLAWLASEDADDPGTPPTRSRTANPHSPVLVITRPDRPAGRGRKLTAPPVADAARALGLRLAQPESVNDSDTHELISSVNPDVLLVCAFGALIKEPLLSGYELLNVHPSLLPRWRGAAPIERAIMAGDEHTGVSIMRLTAGLDSGPVCLAQSEPIAAKDNFGSLALRLQDLGGELLIRALDMLDAGEPLAFSEQDERLVTYAEKIGPDDRMLDPEKSAAQLERRVRALYPHIGARVALAEETLLGVRRASLAPEVPARLGVYADNERLLLGCADGLLDLQEVQPPGKRPMEAKAFLRGHGLPEA
ncbi:MAG: methionyl-tRNA formyltransferase [Solirubrobacteraceae bacterium]